MRRSALVFAICLLPAASALAQSGAAPLDTQLKAALADEASAEAETAKLERAASQAQSEADRLHADQAAAAQAIDAAEARIGAANARLELASAYVEAHRRQLIAEQQPVAALLAGLATMARRPPLLVLADQGGIDQLVEVRLLLNATLPVIRSRTSRLSAELAQGQRLQNAALAARAELARSRDNLDGRRRQYAALEQQAVQRALASGGEALGTGDAAIAASEEVERLRAQQSQSQSVRAVAAQLAGDDAAPASPFAPESIVRRPPFAYQLPALAPVTMGLSSIDASGVRSRGLTLATTRGMLVSAPGAGTVKFSGPFRDYDGVLIIDHGGGWLSLIVNLASPLRAGDKVSIGENIGRALGPLEIELSHNGRHISPALIAGSSQTMSKGPKGG